MGDMLSQDEINALLGGSFASELQDDDASGGADETNSLTDEQNDILGEIGNISMGTSATTLFALLGQKVSITIPKVSVITWRQLADSYDRPCVGIKVNYKEGIEGTNILILKQHDVKIISNLMMGGDGTNISENEPLTDIDLSAIAEAMNQMVGSSSTSIASMINKKIDIETPQAFELDFSGSDFFDITGFNPAEDLVCTGFRMEIGTLIDSEIMQILPKKFAIEMVDTIKTNLYSPPEKKALPKTPEEMPSQQQAPPQQMAQEPPAYMPPQVQAQYTMPDYSQQQQYMPPQMPYPAPDYSQQQQYMPPQQQQMPYYPYPPQMPPYPQQQQQPYEPPQNVKPVQFQNFDVSSVMQQKENIGIIMDVPLEVSVELGRTHKKIKEILEFSPGTIIELDKLAGEPIDILINGKFVAKGEVVVIDENFGIRITDIISVEDRI